MKAHMPVVDGHTDARGDIVIPRKEDREKEHKLNQPWRNRPGLQSRIVLFFELFSSLDVELCHLGSTLLQ